MQVATEAVDAVVLAGGLNEIQLFEGDGTGYKALLPFGDRLAIHYTFDALRAAPAVKRIAVVGPVEKLRPALANYQDVELIEGGETIMDSIYSGLQHFAASPMVLIVTADLPLLTPAAIGDFLAACGQVELTYAENMFFAVVPERSYTGAYAEVPKAFNRFKDIAICHGNLFLVDPRLLKNTHATRRMNALYNARKNPISSALAVGLHVGLTYVLGVHMWHLLSLNHMAQIASRRFELGLIPVVLDHPEVTVDVDEPADYAFVVRQIGLEPPPAAGTDPATPLPHPPTA
ncbi:MAG: nucleotidyltransferase family protein [Armatimonadota bacterium]